MHKILLSTVAILALTSTHSAHAEGLGTALCEYYPGHVDVEGKFGGTRNIGETSIFLPVSCTEDRLFFTDIRLKGDNQDNREGNFALGARFLKETGVLGGYIYFDRKESGVSEKLHSQITTGAEWLTEDYEARVNTYVPVTGDKQTTRTLGAALSTTPVLAGTGIFVEQNAVQIINEEPLWGGDVEAGFKIPDTSVWLHAAAFSFNGEETGSLTGARGRIRYDLNDYVSLSAEGQYDDVRGRMGWLGVRFSVPFGGPAEKPTGLKSRMTASPVRDVDIVTQPKIVAVQAGGLVAVTNTTSGATQRVIYVDNTAAGNGDGSKEKPFNTLAAAQADQRAYDIVYLYTGVGTTGQDQGFTINQRGVQMIGAGTAFVYDSGKFSASNAGNINGTVLIAAGTAPTITNTNVYDGINAESGAGLLIKASDITLTGVTVQGAQGSGIYAHADGISLENISIYNTESHNNQRHGYVIQARNGGTLNNTTLSDAQANNNLLYGTIIQSQSSDSMVDNVTIEDYRALQNGQIGVGAQATATGDIGTINLSRVKTLDNGTYGILLQTSAAGSNLHKAVLRDIETKDNTNAGVYIQLGGTGTIGTVDVDGLKSMNNDTIGFQVSSGGETAINEIILKNVEISGNLTNGISIQASSTGGTLVDLSITKANVHNNGQVGILINTGNTTSPVSSRIQASIQQSSITANGREGIYINHDSTLGTMNIDLGGGGRSTGGNRIFGNGTSNTTTYRDVKLDTNAGPAVPAQNNWWGQAGGPTGTQIVSEGAAPNTGTANTSSPLATDPPH